MAFRPTPALPAPADNNTRTLLGPNARLAVHVDGLPAYQSAADFLAEQASLEPDLASATDLDVADTAQSVLYRPDGTALVVTLAQQRAYFVERAPSDPDLPAAADADIADATQVVVYRPDGTPLVATLAQQRAYFTAGIAGGSEVGLPDVNGLVAHFDPSRSRSVFTSPDFLNPATPGGRVGLLDDASGNGRLVQEGQENVKPLLVERGGRRAVRFIGAEFTRLTAPVGPNWMALNDADITWVFAFRTPSVLPTGTIGMVGSICNEGDPSGGQIVLATTFGTANGPSIAFGRFGNLGGDVLTATSATLPDTGYVVILRSSYSAGTMNMNVNGVDSPQVTTAGFGFGTTFNLFQFGAIRYATDPFTGDLLESALYRTSKDPFGVARLRAYMAAKHF